MRAPPAVDAQIFVRASFDRESQPIEERSASLIVGHEVRHDAVQVQFRGGESDQMRQRLEHQSFALLAFRERVAEICRLKWSAHELREVRRAGDRAATAAPALRLPTTRKARASTATPWSTRGRRNCVSSSPTKLHFNAFPLGRTFSQQCDRLAVVCSLGSRLDFPMMHRGCLNLPEMTDFISFRGCSSEMGLNPPFLEFPRNPEISPILHRPPSRSDGAGSWRWPHPVTEIAAKRSVNVGCDTDGGRRFPVTVTPSKS